MPRRAHVLVVDDEELIRWSLSEHLRGEGFETREAEDGQAALDAIAQQAPDLVITDLKMPNVDGMALLRRLRERDDPVPVIVLTAHGAVDSAVEATRLGAKAYLTKPFDLREVTLEVNRVLEEERLSNEVHYLRGRKAEAYGDIIGSSPAMQRFFGQLARLEDVDAPTILLMGESGTGKDLVANAIHSRGPRAAGPFMEVDCASLPENLIESELFGHEKGSFTDARTTRRGLFELARGGTVFLDEIGEMHPTMQAKLLRSLENRRFRRVGGSASITLDATIIAATHRDLEQLVAEGRFREDLYFRLNVIRLQVPPLRERREDVPALVDHFVQRFNREYRRGVEEISEEAMHRLTAYGWPGNVRELRNVVERMVILEGQPRLDVANLPPEIRHAARPAGGNAGGGFVLPEDGVNLDELERSLIEQALERTGGNQSASARLLGLTRYQLRYRMEKYDLGG
ncbi:MAG: sigma-54-dependent Fis family transcriptional regulator [Alphaproteobacteria bacterium]|nr:sigma-54-dependent Fis family transcriptional regulator [Alphaproteobacteria bacterium]